MHQTNRGNVKVIRKTDLVSELVSWRSRHRNEIEELLIFGSSAQLKSDAGLPSTSDIDLMIILACDESPAYVYEELAILGARLRLLIHPLPITARERCLKLQNPLYAAAYASGEKIQATGSPSQ